MSGKTFRLQRASFAGLSLHNPHRTRSIKRDRWVTVKKFQSFGDAYAAIPRAGAGLDLWRIVHGTRVVYEYGR